MNKKLLVSLLLIAPMGIYAEVSSMPLEVQGSSLDNGHIQIRCPLSRLDPFT